MTKNLREAVRELKTDLFSLVNLVNEGKIKCCGNESGEIYFNDEEFKEYKNKLFAPEKKEITTGQIEERYQCIAQLVGKLAAKKIRAINPQIFQEEEKTFNQYYAHLNRVLEKLKEIYEGEKMPRLREHRPEYFPGRFSGSQRLGKLEKEIEPEYSKKVEEKEARKFYLNCIGFHEKVADEMIKDEKTASSKQLGERIDALEKMFEKEKYIVNHLFIENPELLQQAYPFQKYTTLLEALIEKIRQHYQDDLPNGFNYLVWPEKFASMDKLNELNEKIGQEVVQEAVKEDEIEWEKDIQTKYDPKINAELEQQGFNVDMVEAVILVGFGLKGKIRPFGKKYWPEEHIRKRVMRRLKGKNTAKIYDQTLSQLIKASVVLKAGGRSQGDCYSINPSFDEVPECLRNYLKIIYSK
ncbi:hypothetical protein HZC32_00160 [Candidatus Woesearchaeota archaeon]|nr:hypothetical protein [Candidatus Woesearchaeota archaeon]